VCSRCGRGHAKKVSDGLDLRGHHLNATHDTETTCLHRLQEWVYSGVATTSATSAVLDTRETSMGSGPYPCCPREVALMTISNRAGSTAAPASTVQAGAARRTRWAR
jgi:hypothetical protein